MTSPPHDAAPGHVTRRLLLTLGGAAFVASCSAPTTDRTGQAQPSPRPTTSHPTPSPTRATAKQAAKPRPWHPATPARPISGVCPHVDGVVDKPGGPQHYLPCHGTNIALTIDDGPDPTYTPQLLALLARYRIHATFFMIGSRAALNPSLVARVADGGHHIANHTWSHPLNLYKLSAAQIRDQIMRTSDTLTHLTRGTRPSLFRAPGGIWSPTILAACSAAGLRPLDWSVDPRDWSLPGVPHIADVILTRTRPGSIILEHDGGGNRQQTVDALRIALPRLIDVGYRFAQP